MKRYMYCLFLFIGVSVVCAAAGVFLTRQYYSRQMVTSGEETSASMETVEEEFTVPENRAAANVEHVVRETAPANEYYLVVEDGFLLVLLKDQKTICLYTHIPITEFPAKEQEKLREGIWFSDMIEVVNYLESYTS